MGMGDHAVDYQHDQGQQFGRIPWDRDLDQPPSQSQFRAQHSGYGAYPQIDFVGRNMRFAPYGNRGGMGNRQNDGVSLAQVLSRPQAEARRDPFMLVGPLRGRGVFGHAITGGWSQPQQPVAHLQQNYYTDPPPRYTTPATVPAPQFEYPTRFGGSFARALSTIARNPVEGAQGTGYNMNNSPTEKFHNEFSQAVALKLNLKTQQHANEKMLRTLMGTGGQRSVLKQAVQARAAVYDQVIDPS